MESEIEWNEERSDVDSLEPELLFQQIQFLSSLSAKIKKTHSSERDKKGFCSATVRGCMPVVSISREPSARDKKGLSSAMTVRDMQHGRGVRTTSKKGNHLLIASANEIPRIDRKCPDLPASALLLFFGAGFRVHTPLP